MTLIRGGPAGPDGAGGAYVNEVEADRAALWDALGGRQGVIKGFVHSGVAGEMALDFTPGSALVGERAADGTASLARGYHVWEAVTTRVQFAPASPAARNDAVVAAFVDVEDGPMGTGVTEVGPQLIAVTGVSGTTTPRTDADINAFVGRGGWVRLMDVPVASGDTEVNVANIDTTVRTLATEPFAKLVKNIDNNLSNSLNTSLVGYHEVEEASPASFADLANHALVAPQDGLYQITLQVTFASNGTGSRRVCLLVNGAQVMGQEVGGRNVGLDGQSIILSAVWRLSTGDAVTGGHAQDSGGTLVLPGSSTQAATTFLSALWLRG